MRQLSINDQIWNLRALSAEVSAISHLIRIQNTQEISEEDLQEIHSGLGLVLERIAKRVRVAAKSLERIEITAIQAENPNQTISL